MPIAWDGKRKTYHFTRPCECVPLLRLNDREALMLAIVGRVIASWRAVPFGRELAAILQKIADVLGGDIAATSAAMDRLLSLPAIEAGPELDHLLPVLEAARARRTLALEYAGAHAARPEKRLVHPLHVRHDRRHWQLLAYVPASSRICTLRLARIRKLSTLQTTFEPPPQWNVTRRVAGSMGGFSSDEEHDIRFALDAHAAFYAREDPWHASQTLHPLPDGRTELRLRLNNLADAKFAALHWGEHVEVLAPTDLREDVQKSLQAALARYQGGAGHKPK
jgi:proteasome accessory factor B